MSFKDCIRSAAQMGRITPQKAIEAELVYDEAYTQAIDEGLTGGAANDRAAAVAVERAMKMTAEAKWRRINEMRVADRLWREFQPVTNFAEALRNKVKQIELAQERIIGFAHAQFSQNLEVYRPRALGLYQPKAYDKDIVRALYGENVGKTTARELADEVYNVMEYLRKLANSYGASIPENPNRRMPQEHDYLKMRLAGRDKWVEDHLKDSVLDWDLMTYQGKYIPKSQRVTALQRVYDTITTDGYNKIDPAQGFRPESLAAALSGERFLYYKTSKAWTAMNEAYGRGNVFQQLVGTIEVMAKNIAMMEQLGPNPEAGAGLVRNIVRRRAADLDNEATAKGGTKGRSFFQRAEADVSIFDDRLRVLDRRVASGEEQFIPNAMSATRTTVTASILGGAFISAFGDLGFGRHMAMVNRLPHMKLIRSYARYMLPRGRRGKQLAIRSGLIAESATGIASGYQRYFGPATGGALARRYADVTFRATLLTPHTQAAKWAWGMELLGAFADARTDTFDQLPFRTMLERYGIDAKDWDTFRSSEVFTDRGAEFLRPVDLALNGTPAQRKVANKFQDMVIDTGRKAVPTVGVETRTALGEATNPNSFIGQVARTFGMVKSFPVAMYHLYWLDMLERQGTADKLAYVGSYLVWTALAGAFIAQMQEIRNGRDPSDMTDPAFLGRALLYGGTFGLFADIASQGLGSLTGGPLPDTVDQGLNAIRQAADGDPNTNPSGELIRLLQTFTPGSNWWQIRLLLERSVWDVLQREADPQAYQRRRLYERQRATEEGRESFWPIGESAPTRAPNFSNAVGQ